MDSSSHAESADVPIEYEVIGEHVFDPRHLLTVDTDGHLFDLDLETCSASPTELTDSWVVDTVEAGLNPQPEDKLLSPPVSVTDWHLPESLHQVLRESRKP